jgi:hypothetical protein
MNPNNRGCIIGVLAVLCVLSAQPAFAQIDFTGEWAPLYHEDSPEPLPGPELTAEERRALQRECRGARILRFVCRAKRGYVVRGDNGRRRSNLFD